MPAVMMPAVMGLVTAAASLCVSGRYLEGAAVISPTVGLSLFRIRVCGRVRDQRMLQCQHDDAPIFITHPP